jgi:protein-S-isoprenylcysteine O-methyltransferase Ste14
MAGPDAGADVRSLPPSCRCFRAHARPWRDHFRALGGPLVWSYLQYLLVGNYRLPRAGGGWGMEAPPGGIITSGPYRHTRNPMYLRHLMVMVGLMLTFWSWFAFILLAARALWFHRRVLRDKQRHEARFGVEYAAYRSKVNRWIPGVL